MIVTGRFSVSADQREKFDAWAAGLFADAQKADEVAVHKMLEHWVSESEPVIVYDADGFLLGLTSIDRALRGNSELVVAIDWRFPTEFPLQHFDLCRNRL